MLVDTIRGRGVVRGGPRIGKGRRSGAGGPRIGQPPPFIGTWGRGKKKDRRKRSPSRKEQSIQKHSIDRRHTLKFKKTVPLTNFDLVEWTKYLRILLNNVLSRDEKVPHNHKLALFVYNLEPHYMSGSHWVATYVRDGVINYFDSFGMPPFQEIVDQSKEKKLNSPSSK